MTHESSIVTKAGMLLVMINISVHINEEISEQIEKNSSTGIFQILK